MILFNTVCVVYLFGNLKAIHSCIHVTVNCIVIYKVYFYILLTHVILHDWFWLFFLITSTIYSHILTLLCFHHTFHLIYVCFVTYKTHSINFTHKSQTLNCKFKFVNHASISMRFIVFSRNETFPKTTRIQSQNFSLLPGLFADGNAQKVHVACMSHHQSKCVIIIKKIRNF